MYEYWDWLRLWFVNPQIFPPSYGLLRNKLTTDCPIGNALKDNNDAFDMPEGIRDTLSTVLIIHPVAAALTLVMCIMAITSHFHAPSHSARYLLAMFILTILTFLVCLAAFVIDVLLFIPNMAWGSYIVLAAAIMVLLSGVVTCIMRRSLISRKTRRKNIAENAEMSGENFYAREAHNKPISFNPPPPIPLTSGANGGGTDNLPAFATFEQQKKDDEVSDERIPLTTRSPSGASPNNRTNDMTNEVTAMNAPSRSASRDRYGNPINGPPDGYGVGKGPSMESMRSRGSSHGYRGGRGHGPGPRGYDMYGAPMRGRGGYGPPGRGGYGPRGGRGGLAPPPRGGYGPGPMRGGRSPPPPPGYGGQYDRRPSPAEAYGAYGGRPNDGYSTNPSTNPSMPSVNGGYEPYNPEGTNFPRAESPPAMSDNGARSGQAVEMDATPADQNQGYTPYGGQLRDNDSDVAGMVGLQQGQPPGRHDTYMSEASKYSTDE